MGFVGTVITVHFVIKVICTGSNRTKVCVHYSCWGCLKFMEIRSGHSELYVVSLVSAIEGCLLSGTCNIMEGMVSYLQGVFMVLHVDQSDTKRALIDQFCHESKIVSINSSMQPFPILLTNESESKNLLASRGETWMAARRIITPSLSASKMKMVRLCTYTKYCRRSGNTHYTIIISLSPIGHLHVIKM